MGNVHYLTTVKTVPSFRIYYPCFTHMPFRKVIPSLLFAFCNQLIDGLIDR